MAKWNPLKTTPNYAAIKDKAAIRDIVEDYVPIPDWATRGTKWRSRCPVHNGHNDTAFMVDEEKNRWFCFRCGVGGSVIDLVMRIEGVPLEEAAQKIAMRLGDIGVIDRSQVEARTIERRVKAWQDWKKQPPPLGDEGVPDRHALEACRDLSRDAITLFGLGRVPGDGWGTGVFIPLRNERGVLVGYSIRQHDHNSPKYLNSAGLPKGSLLYGLYENQIEILDDRQAVVVEGQFDCMALWDRGIRDAVAIMGSSLTPRQATILANYADTLVLMLDSDCAGRRAMRKIKEQWDCVFDIKVALLPMGKDPDETNTEALKEVLRRAK